MAGQDKRIRDLPPLPGADVTSNDVMPIVDISAFETKKITFNDLKQEIIKDTQEKLPEGADGKVLSWASGQPVWIDFTPSGPILNIGDPNTDGSWRFTVTPTGLVIQVRLLGVWEKRGQWSKD